MLDETRKLYKERAEKSAPDLSKQNSKVQDAIDRLSKARNSILAVSNYRHDGLKADLFSVIPVGQLCALTASYYVASEPRYEELEAMPIPPDQVHLQDEDSLYCAQS